MNLTDFDFHLPPTLIAQHPVRPRDAARLLVVDEQIRDRAVRELTDILRPGDLLVLNDTKVLPMRLFGRRGDVAIEMTLIEEQDGGRWRALGRPARRLKPGQQIVFAPGFAAEVVAKAAGRLDRPGLRLRSRPTRPRPRGARCRTFAALHPARRRRSARPRRLSDGLCRQDGRGRRAHRGPALHLGPAARSRRGMASAAPR